LQRTLFIHAGPPKTGSTAIQQFLRDNAEGLARLGFYWPRAGTERCSHNHVDLAYAFARPPRASPLVAELAAELRDADWPAQVLISAEHFAVRIADPAYFARLAAHCQKLGYRPHIIAYLRSQPAAINSLYTQLVKNWRPVPLLSEFISEQLDSPRFDYSRMFAAVVASSEAQLTLRPYDRQTLARGLVGDFLETLGIASTSTAGFTGPRTINTSPGPRTVAAFLQLKSMVMAENPAPDRTRMRALTRPLIMASGQLGWNQESFHGIDAAAHAAIVDHFAQSNDAVTRGTWGRPWRDIFGAEELQPRPTNIFVPAHALPTDRRNFEAFIEEALEAVRDFAGNGVDG
jgi:hypothetical protein